MKTSQTDTNTLGNNIENKSKINEAKSSSSTLDIIKIFFGILLCFLGIAIIYVLMLLFKNLSIIYDLLIFLCGIVLLITGIRLVGETAKVITPFKLIIPLIIIGVLLISVSNLISSPSWITIGLFFVIAGLVIGLYGLIANYIQGNTPKPDTVLTDRLYPQNTISIKKICIKYAIFGLLIPVISFVLSVLIYNIFNTSREINSWMISILFACIVIGIMLSIKAIIFSAQQKKLDNLENYNLPIVLGVLGIPIEIILLCLTFVLVFLEIGVG